MKLLKKQILSVVMFFILVFLAFGSDDTTSDADNNVKLKPVKKDLYSIINKECWLPYKCSIDVRLKEIISENELKNLAFNIKANLSEKEAKASKIFISYLLPGTVSDQWARSDFTPSLEIRIHGISKKEAEKLKSEPNPKGKVIGSWFNNLDKIKYTIFKRKNHYFSQSVFYDGSKMEERLTGKKVKGKMR